MLWAVIYRATKVLANRNAVMCLPGFWSEKAHTPQWPSQMVLLGDVVPDPAGVTHPVVLIQRLSHLRSPNNSLPSLNDVWLFSWACRSLLDYCTKLLKHSSFISLMRFRAAFIIDSVGALNSLIKESWLLLAQCFPLFMCWNLNLQSVCICGQGLWRGDVG